MTPLIAFSEVSKAFRIPSVQRNTVRDHVLGVLEPRRYERLQVLDRVSFEVQPGEALGIMGRNGCGKSTLLKILCGVYEPDSGTVIRRAAITPILELGVGWNPELDAIDNICLVGSVMGLSLPEIRRRMDAILAFSELERFANLKLKHYSSGMAARLGYAIAFEAAREVLVLDEVFAVGDAGFRAKCEARYRALHATGHTIVMVSHDRHAITSFCTRALLIERGQVMESADPVSVSRSYFSLLGEADREPPVRPARDTAAINMGDLRRTTPFSRHWGYDRGTPVDRYYIDGFLARHAPDIRGRVLEVGGREYADRFGTDAVDKVDVLNLYPHQAATTIVADLQEAPHLPDGVYDCVILTQVLPYVFDVHASLATLHRILRPGGVLLGTVPGIAHTGDDVWGPRWFWNFTPVSIRRLLAAQFPAETIHVETHGNVLSASAFLYGMAAEELSGAELNVRDPAYDVTIAFRVVSAGRTGTRQ